MININKMLLRSIIELREVWSVSNDRKASSGKRLIVLFKLFYSDFVSMTLVRPCTSWRNRASSLQSLNKYFLSRSWLWGLVSQKDAIETNCNLNFNPFLLELTLVVLLVGLCHITFERENAGKQKRDKYQRSRNLRCPTSRLWTEYKGHQERRANTLRRT